MVFTENDINGRNSIYWSQRYKVIRVTKWIARNSASVGICLFTNMAVVCKSCGRVMWISIHSYFYASTSIHPPPPLQKNGEICQTTLCHFFRRTSWPT